MTTEVDNLTNSDPEVQSICRKLVEREVIFNVGSWVQALTDSLGSGGSTDYIDYEETFSWWRGEADKLEAIRNAGYDVCRDEDGSWYWFEQGDPQPFGDDPPSDYEIDEVLDDTQQLEELGVDQDGWYWGYLSADYLPENRCQTYEEAVVACWMHEAPEAFGDEEDAIEDCVDTNSVDLDDAQPEVYEHWLVTPYFADRLQTYGEAVFDICGDQVWGRTCTGQAILLDNVIFRIAKDMEILPGQPNYQYWKED